ncbi:MAG: serine protease [Proteobacteria bacterium]|nr:serine protease [Desulfobulbaceae bacterium]MBU4151315.1 serine protease [Pseudomonadota bacterium]MDP2106144.1 NfeD family protein [Desulfobulbaceae bacterium]
MKAYLIPIILQLVGVAVVIAEIILPSAGLLTVLALSIFGYSLYLVFQEISPVAGIVFVAADIIMIPTLVVIGIKMLARSPVTLHTELSSKQGVTSQSSELDRYLGQEGRALTDLRPAGMAQIMDKRVDVVTRGEYIERGTDLIVLAVTANQIVVRKRGDGREH